MHMKSFPDQIPIFPLTGVIYFPKTNLPLNIFEQRYLELVNDAFKKDKLMGMVQSKRKGKEVYRIGCLGKINDLQKAKDGRILINLTGLTRFEVMKEITSAKLYREFKVDYDKFGIDLTPSIENVNIEQLMHKSKIFFKKNGLLLNWDEFEKLDKVQKVNTLAMIAPITNEEKQKLLETITVQDKAKILLEIIEFYLYDSQSTESTIQ